MEDGSPLLEYVTYGIVGFLGLAMLLLALRTAWFFLSLLMVPVLGALGRTRLAGAAVRRWGERGPHIGLPVMGPTDEAAVAEAAAASRVQIPRAIRLGVRAGVAVGASPGVWYAGHGALLARARGDSAWEIAGHVALALCLVSPAGALLGAGAGGLAGLAIDAGRGRAVQRRAERE
jgi:hypothetical protein